jgi:hypothetical protein
MGYPWPGRADPQPDILSRYGGCHHVDRPYRKGRSFEDARREVERYSGSQFDPQLVEVFLAIPQERWQKAKLDTLRTLRLPTIH